MKLFKWKLTCCVFFLREGLYILPFMMDFQYFYAVMFSNSLFYSSMYLPVFLFIIVPISR